MWSNRRTRKMPGRAAFDQCSCATVEIGLRRPSHSFHRIRTRRMILTSSRRTFLTGAAGAAACAALGHTNVRSGRIERGSRTDFGFCAPNALSAGPGPSSGPQCGYDGVVPGPLLRVRQGDELKIRLVNELAAATAIHWHGIRAPNAMDGVPISRNRQTAENARFEYRFRASDAGTYWYHAPHTLPGQMRARPLRRSDRR